MRSVFEGDRRLARDAGMRRQPPVRAGCGAGALGAVTVVRFSQQGCLRAGAGVNGPQKGPFPPRPCRTERPGRTVVGQGGGKWAGEVLTRAEP